MKSLAKIARRKALPTLLNLTLTDRWSAKAEYMYYDLGQETYRIDNGLIAEAETRGSTVRIGPQSWTSANAVLLATLDQRLLRGASTGRFDRGT